MATAQGTAARPAARSSQGGLLSGSLRIFFWLFLSLLLSILIEWLGLIFWWPDLGSMHARQMYDQELAYLSGDLGRSVISEDPVGFARTVTGWVEYCWTASGLVDLIAWIGSPPADASTFRLSLYVLHDYAVATVYVTLVFSTRVAILLLSLPIFILFGLVGLVDGLVERDLRRFSAGRESSYVFHLAKRAVTPMVVLTWALYLSMPVSIHPAVIILPFAAICAVFIRLTASSFKKYL